MESEGGQNASNYKVKIYIKAEEFFFRFKARRPTLLMNSPPPC